MLGHLSTVKIIAARLPDSFAAEAAGGGVLPFAVAPFAPESSQEQVDDDVAPVANCDRDEVAAACAADEMANVAGGAEGIVDPGGTKVAVVAAAVAFGCA